MITTRDLAAIFGVTTRCVHYWVAQGLITPASRGPGKTSPMRFDLAVITGALRHGP
jgi:phage terminase Nu1 subunit (DNA packaging protein)